MARCWGLDLSAHHMHMHMRNRHISRRQEGRRTLEELAGLLVGEGLRDAVLGLVNAGQHLLQAAMLGHQLQGSLLPYACTWPAAHRHLTRHSLRLTKTM